jgi:hypothetical protein
MNLADDAVIANPDTPGITVGKFFASCWTRVGFQFSKFGEDAGFGFAGQSFQLLSRGTGKDDAIPHFRLAERAFR